MGVQDSGAILCFHGLTASPERQPSRLHVTLEAFQEAVAVANRVGEIVPLSELVSRHRRGRSTSGLVALTFDDAYRSLLDEAGRFIGGPDIPAAVFVVSNAAESGAAYWWDRVEEAIVREDPGVWRRITAASGLPTDLPSDPAARLDGLRTWILSEYRGVCPPRLSVELDRLDSGRQAGGRQRSMTWDELVRLARHDVIEIGVHTRHHPVLPLLSAEEVKSEIAGAYQDIVDHVEGVVPVLAVPYGLTDARTVELAVEAGMDCSLGLRGTTLAKHSDAAELQRINVLQDDPPWKLEMRLRGFTERIKGWMGRLPSRYPPLPS